MSIEKLSEGFWDAIVAKAKQEAMAIGAGLGSKAMQGKLDAHMFGTELYDQWKIWSNASGLDFDAKNLETFLRDQVDFDPNFVKGVIGELEKKAQVDDEEKQDQEQKPEDQQQQPATESLEEASLMEKSNGPSDSDLRKIFNAIAKAAFRNGAAKVAAKNAAHDGKLQQGKNGKDIDNPLDINDNEIEHIAKLVGKKITPYDIRALRTKNGQKYKDVVSVVRQSENSGRYEEDAIDFLKNIFKDQVDTSAQQATDEPIETEQSVKIGFNTAVWDEDSQTLTMDTKPYTMTNKGWLNAKNHKPVSRAQAAQLDRFRDAWMRKYGKGQMPSDGSDVPIGSELTINNGKYTKTKRGWSNENGQNVKPDSATRLDQMWHKKQTGE